jgi:hypothetical protein
MGIRLTPWMIWACVCVWGGDGGSALFSLGFLPSHLAARLVTRAIATHGLSPALLRYGCPPTFSMRACVRACVRVCTCVRARECVCAAGRQDD